MGCAASWRAPIWLPHSAHWVCARHIAVTPRKASRGRGPFIAGDLVQLTDPKGRMHTVELMSGKEFHTHRGLIQHDALIGQPEGVVVTSAGGTTYVAFRP